MSTHLCRPRIAMTMGDVAGVGPEVIVGVWSQPAVHRWCRPLVIGHPEIFRRAAAFRRVKLKIVEIREPAEADPSPKVLPCLWGAGDDVLEVQPGRVDARAGQAAYQAVVEAARLALARQIDAITTAPIHKEAWQQAGHRYPGHTELLAETCGAERFAMALYLGPQKQQLAAAGLAVVHVTLHLALREVFGQLSEEAILRKARLVDQFMARLLQAHAAPGEDPRTCGPGRQDSQGRSARPARPRIGVCALNPHGGEGGLFGEEERRIIRPAVARGQAEGMMLAGPLPADTLMVAARDGHYDAVVAMHHDQGHIALKLLGMHRAVNVTLGLPIIRTSVAHGTAFDIAWQQPAETGSLCEAIRVAAELAGSVAR